MGRFYTNVSLRVERRRAIDWFNKAHEPAWIGPQQGLWCVAAYDAAYSIELVEPPSLDLRCLAIGAMVVDDDVLRLSAAVDGRSFAVYESRPGYGDPAVGPQRLAPTINGMANLLVALDSPVGEADLMQVLTKPEEFVFASELHERLFEMLGLPRYAAAFGYDYAGQGEFPGGLSSAEFVRTP
jgi:hypothetical protein